MTGLNTRVPHYFKLSGVDANGDRIVRTDESLSNLKAICMRNGTLSEVKDGKTRVLWRIHN